jgi:DNA-binding transcriptional MerR regulator
MASHPTRKRVIDSPVIPDRLYFKIGDVARLCGVEPYVLRFWETQFPQLKPNKSGTGQRLYRRREVEMALEIKRLVHGEGYTISGARQALEGHRRPQPPANVPQSTPARTQAPSPEPAPRPAESPKRPEAVIAAVGQIRAELREIASLLSSQQPRPPRPRARVVTLSPESGSLFPL